MHGVLTQERIRKISWVQAPILFKIPFIRSFLQLCGAGTPATKECMHDLFAKRSDFGILPGGSEEVLAFQSGQEIAYIKHRAGFIKYALQHGYRLCIGYTFGESDLYHSLDIFTGLRM